MESPGLAKKIAPDLNPINPKIIPSSIDIPWYWKMMSEERREARTRPMSVPTPTQNAYSPLILEERSLSLYNKASDKRKARAEKTAGVVIFSVF
jgi:hypothetical protein